ncbi:PIH1 domain-containing protein 1-like [Amphibalanus amphitrite]|uniref:PIH1 domain-containing protein 1-like n=1 Tax=Amphibalanus amphitrite TaxID=1232801 RepID=UPI001C922A6F|nr:PIH1 domain-containing protein 1-like [Amphibalanus amphitrite]XP_043220141.1 PIH1 domain-containing protein 1-like [Amphibalanus amphitrite]XP_043220142.1 PIH1 domain-containing protein 1-like [Amphibalanus amphitrite]
MSSTRGAFLDVQPELLTSSLSVVGGGADPELSELAMPAEAAARQRRSDAVEIVPKPVVCCKTRDAAGGKVFVNICTNTEIPAPRQLSEQQLRELLQDEAQAAEFRVPLSLSEAHKELDKSGGPCVAYDVVIHPRFYAQVDSSLLFKTFFITVMIEAIEGKFGIELDKNQWVTMRNKLYMGKMPKHFVRRGDLPMVQEVAGGEAPSAGPRPLISEVETRRSAPPAPPHTVERRPDGRLVVTFELPPAVTAADQLSLELAPDRVVLSSETVRLLADVFLTETVEPETARAAFSLASRRLAVSVATAAA